MPFLNHGLALVDLRLPLTLHSGGTTVSAGTLQLGAGNAVALGTGGLTVNGGLVDLQGNSLTFANGNALPSLAGTGGVITDSSSEHQQYPADGQPDRQHDLRRLDHQRVARRGARPGKGRRRAGYAFRQQYLRRRHDDQCWRVAVRHKQRPAHDWRGQRQWRRPAGVELQRHGGRGDAQQRYNEPARTDIFSGTSYNVQSGVVSANLDDNGGSAPCKRPLPGTVVLSGNNSYTGGTGVSAGLLN